MDFGSGLWDGNKIGIPYNIVPFNQPKVPVSVTLYPSQSDFASAPVPNGALVEPPGDAHMLVLQSGSCMLYELYQAQQSGGQWEASSTALFNLSSNALRPAGWTSADASGSAIFPGLVKWDEIASGEIRHAIRFTVPNTRAEYIWPATHWATSYSQPSHPPMGQRFRLKASFDISTFSARMQVLLRALKKYGMMVMDNGSAWYLSGSPDERWDNDELHTLDVIKGTDFEAVDVSGLMITATSGKARQS